MRYTVRRNLISRNPEINKKKRRSFGGGHPYMHVHKYLSNLLHNVYAFSKFPVRKQITLALFRNRKDNIVSTFLLFGSPFPSPFKVRSKFGRFLLPFRESETTNGEPVRTCIIFFCMLIYQAISLVN